MLSAIPTGPAPAMPPSPAVTNSPLDTSVRFSTLPGTEPATSKPRPLKTEMLPIVELRSYPDNPRPRSPERVAQINGSVGEFCWTTPILVDAEGSVSGGHGRLEAAEQRGMDQVPVIGLAHLSPE